MMSYSLAGNNVKYGAEQAANPDGSGTISQRIGNPSCDTGTLAQVCSKQVNSSKKRRKQSSEKATHRKESL